MILDALVIALDLSRSMDAADIKPSRLARARFKINDILRKRVDGQTALLVYAAEPYVVSPLTDDTNTIIAQLPALVADLMPNQGSRPDRALRKAAELLRQAGATRGTVLLVSDGVDAAEAIPAARELNAAGIRTSVLGVGTESGGPIPAQGGFVKQANGDIVVARLDTRQLEALAREGGGTYRALTDDDTDIDALLRVAAPLAGDTADTGLQTDVWREEGPWLLLPLLPLVALLFRRGTLAVFVLAVCLPHSPASAFTAADLWTRPDQRAADLLEAGDPAAASDVFADPAWKAAAAYRAGNYAESLSALEGLDDIESVYNRGNSLARLDRFAEAMAAYENVLERDPEHQDARHNLELLQQLQDQENAEQNQGQNDKPNESSTQDQQAADGSEGQSGQQSRDGAEAEADAATNGGSPGRSGSEDMQNGSPDNAEAAANDNRDNMQAAQPETEANDGRSAGEDSAADAEQAAAASGSQEAKSADRGSSAAGESEDDSAAPDDRPGIAAARESGESEQATEQWLRKIPDDPGGLLRRKFMYQYRQSPQEQEEAEPW